MKVASKSEKKMYTDIPTLSDIMVVAIMLTNTKHVYEHLLHQRNHSVLWINAEKKASSECQ